MDTEFWYVWTLPQGTITVKWHGDMKKPVGEFVRTQAGRVKMLAPLQVKLGSKTVKMMLTEANGADTLTVEGFVD